MTFEIVCASGIDIIGGTEVLGYELQIGGGRETGGENPPVRVTKSRLK